MALGGAAAVPSVRLQVAGRGLRRAVGLHWRRRGGAARGSRAALGVGAALISATVVGGLSSSAVAVGVGFVRQWWALVVGVVESGQEAAPPHDHEASWLRGEV